MAMIAAYRAERLTQRPVLRTTLRDSHVARRAARMGDQAPAEPGQPAIADAAVPAAPAADPTTPGQASIFAGLVSTAVAEQEASRLQDTEATDDVPSAAPIAAEPEPVADEPETQPPAAPEAPPYDPPLAEIGFGPGMLIRLSQLGLHTTRDLAQANAGQLRSELGEISRLVDVDAWIKSARQTTRTAAGG